jgi:hypothetical protein
MLRNGFVDFIPLSPIVSETFKAIVENGFFESSFSFSGHDEEAGLDTLTLRLR